MKNIDVLIIGQGPAGLSAAIYTARAGLKVMVLGCDPRVAGDYQIDNYFGFPETISGMELISRGVAQAVRFGAVIECEKVLSVHPSDPGFTVKTEKSEYNACSVILATGVDRKKPPIKNISDYEGKGVSYCVSCDGYFVKNKKVLVAGEGNYAANQALELLNYTKDIKICTMGIKSSIDTDFTEKLKSSGIKIIEKKISMIKGEKKVTHAVLETGEEIEIDGLFVAMGNASSIDFARSIGIVTEGNFIIADSQQKTNVPGIFAAGDCVGGFLQISVAVGEGAKAAKSAADYVKTVCR